MKMMKMKTRFTKLFLILALVLTSCGDAGTYKGKYSRLENTGALTITRYFLVYESCFEQNGKETCRQYEREVDESTYNSK